MTLTERLTEAEAALHQLNIGRHVVEVQEQNGERIRYGAPDRARLQAYIADLKRQINGTCVGPLEFWGR